MLHHVINNNCKTLSCSSFFLWFSIWACCSLNLRSFIFSCSCFSLDLIDTFKINESYQTRLNCSMVGKWKNSKFSIQFNNTRTRRYTENVLTFLHALPLFSSSFPPAAFSQRLLNQMQSVLHLRLHYLYLSVEIQLDRNSNNATDQGFLIIIGIGILRNYSFKFKIR